ncbi:impb mucb samb family [Trichoderma cornu-damae]|uniref:Impb mucb samb family n=1 Tax=Trichoderma cornu-damae TaxID=654480 RepID=A0A9P8TYT4_9HYPO|nr:impb mucb samb family [Trichoderma cornu-damae]
MDSEVVKRPPRRNQDRIILQFDYDCFYAQVLENKNPALKSRPLGVRQKNILATCNYNARRRNVRKLMLVSEAKKACPELVLVDGEDLTPFRDVSKMLFNFLRSHSWNGKAERLGFDEVFLDVTDIVDYNLSCLSRASMAESFFYLSKKDPELGFACDLTSVAGCTAGVTADGVDHESPAYLRHLLGSHLAQYLRLKLEQDFGYTSTCGISTNKLLSKLVGSKNKPRNQTTLLALTDDDVVSFVDGHKLRAIPGMGSKITRLVESRVMSGDVAGDSGPFDSLVTAREARLHPTISPSFLETLLGGPGAERGIGSRVWGLLHGVDPTPVKETNDVPSQISIEDTYRGLETMPRIAQELHKLSCSLIRRMRVDLVVSDRGSDAPGTRKWIARPKTLRLSIRSWPKSDASRAPSFGGGRVSRSGPLPNFVFDLKADVDEIAQQLVADALLPLLRRLQSEKGQTWNLQLINICAANMVAGAADDKTGAGRDIAAMLKRQDEVLAPWRITSSDAGEDEQKNAQDEEEGSLPEDLDPDFSWEATDNSTCLTCGRCIPSFALSAHSRYHELGE